MRVIPFKTRFHIKSWREDSYGLPFDESIVYTSRYVAGEFTTAYSEDGKYSAGGVLMEDCIPVEEVPSKNYKVDYSFNVPHQSRIDTERIHNELSYSDPFAIVRFDGMLYAVLHNSLDEKCRNSVGGWELHKEMSELVTKYRGDRGHIGAYTYSIKHEAIKDICKLIRKIKSLPYKNKPKDGTVEVTHVKV